MEKRKISESPFGQNVSYWIASTSDTNYPTLKTSITTDVAIIGGGIVGITLGWVLKKAGFKVALLEAFKIAKNVTGHTTAKVTSQHHLIYSYLIKKYGKEKAKMYADSQEAGLNFIANLIKKERIDCDFVRDNAHVYTVSSEDLNAIEREIFAAQVLGLPVSFTDKTNLPFRIKIGRASCRERV